MITGTHVLLYSQDPEADRAFFRDILGFRSVDAGKGWLIFALPPAEMGIHPAGAGATPGAELYLMCDDLRATMKTLEAKKVKCTAVEEALWGMKTTFKLPSGGEVGLYQPRHPTAF